MEQLKGKQLSLEAKIFAGIFVIAAFILNSVFKWSLSMRDILMVGGFIALVFSPVDLSLIAKNIRGQ